jgi:uncharacterized protein YhfF
MILGRSPEPSDVDGFSNCRSTQFGNSSYQAERLGQLIVMGVKTATCSALWEYEAENERLPVPGDRTIVLDDRSMPLCVIETYEVEIRKFCDVDAAFAEDEGEGDRTLESWRREHWKFFTETLAAINREPNDEMPLVCERFRIIHTW